MEDIDKDRWRTTRTALEGSDERWPALLRAGGAQQEWAHGLLNMLCLLAGPDVLTFVESEVGQDPAGGVSVRIVALTSTRVIAVDAIDGDHAGVARAYPRRSIRSVEVLELRGDPEADERFPSAVRVRVQLEQQEGLELGVTASGRSRLAAVYGSLLHDLD